MKNWDYSILTRNANIHGGPEKYINQIKINASQNAIKMTNKKWLKRTIPTFLILAPFTIKGIYDISQETIPKIKLHFNKSIITNEEEPKAEKKLIKHYSDTY